MSAEGKPQDGLSRFLGGISTFMAWAEEQGFGPKDKTPAEIKAAIASVRSQDTDNISVTEKRAYNDALDRVEALLLDGAEKDHPCPDYPAPCNCDDPETHNGH